MKLQEYQLKVFFKKYGIPIPVGHVTSVAREAKQIAEEIGSQVVVKAQVLAEGRGMSGGIRLAKTPEETESIASEILASHIQELPVDRILVDEAISIEKEYYLLITFDRAKKLPLLMMYDTGSIYIEAAAAALFDNLERIYIDPLIGLQRYQIRDLAVRLDFPQKYLRVLTEICLGMWNLFCDMDATLVAINPLAISKDQRLLALDGKISLDDDAYFRQEGLFDYRPSGALSDSEYEARKYGMAYIKMDGNIGCLMNGSGLTMACMDYIRSQSGNPANYLDMGGCIDSDKVVTAMDLLYADDQVEVIIVNIYGGMTHCDVVAEGLLVSMEKNGTDIPVIARFSGTNSELARQKLQGTPVILADDMPRAVTKAMQILGEKE